MTDTRQPYNVVTPQDADSAPRQNTHLLHYTVARPLALASDEVAILSATVTVQVDGELDDATLRYIETQWLLKPGHWRLVLP